MAFWLIHKQLVHQNCRVLCDCSLKLECTFPEENMNWCLQWQISSPCCYCVVHDSIRANKHVCTMFWCWDVAYSCVQWLQSGC